jgi:hypothetical protein
VTTPRTYALGRHVEHDEQSRRFAYRVAAVKPKTVLWEHHTAVLDQGQLGSCTGNALAQWLNTDFGRNVGDTLAYFPALSDLRTPLLEADAIRLYSLATRLDRFPGQYPPDDTGSSGLAVCKAGVRFRFLRAYHHVFSFPGLLMALQQSPVITGTTWTEHMCSPDSQGMIWPIGDELGGHEYLLLGCDMEHEYITLLNSWGPNWGDNGRAKMDFESFRALLADDGDVTVPLI